MVLVVDSYPSLLRREHFDRSTTVMVWHASSYSDISVYTLAAAAYPLPVSLDKLFLEPLAPVCGSYGQTAPHVRHS